MRVSKHHFDVSESGLARMIRHLTTGKTAGAFEALQVEANDNRFLVVLTPRQLSVLEDRERDSLLGEGQQVIQRLQSEALRPRLGRKYD